MAHHPPSDATSERVDGMAAEDYFAAPGISSTDLKQWASKTPRDWRYWKDHPVEETEAMKLGSAIHCAVLEADQYDKRFTCYGGRRSGAAYDEFCAENPNRTILSKSSQEVVDAATDYLYSKDRLHKVIQGGESEVSYFHRHLDGRVRKARADWIGTLNDSPIIIDLKTTYSLEDRHLSKTVANMRYALQGAYYLDVASACEPREVNAFAILWVRTTMPVDFRLCVLHPDAIEYGRKQYTAAWEELTGCLDRNEFPGYSIEPFFLELPKWAMTDD